MSQVGKREFLFKNLGKGLLWLAILIFAFVLIKKNVDLDATGWLVSLGDKPYIVYTIYIMSELLIGIIPPEMFMMWSVELTTGRSYVLDVALLAVFSYIAGTVMYVKDIFAVTRIFSSDLAVFCYLLLLLHQSHIQESVC